MCGNGVSQPHTRCIGDSSDRKQRSYKVEKQAMEIKTGMWFCELILCETNETRTLVNPKRVFSKSFAKTCGRHLSFFNYLIINLIIKHTFYWTFDYAVCKRAFQLTQIDQAMSVSRTGLLTEYVRTTWQ